MYVIDLSVCYSPQCVYHRPECVYYRAECVCYRVECVCVCYRVEYMCVIELCGNTLYLYLYDLLGRFPFGPLFQDKERFPWRVSSWQVFTWNALPHSPVSSSWVLGTGLKAYSTVGNHFHHEEPIQPRCPTLVTDHRKSHMSRAAPDADSQKDLFSLCDISKELASKVPPTPIGSQFPHPDDINAPCGWAARKNRLFQWKREDNIWTKATEHPICPLPIDPGFWILSLA